MIRIFLFLILINVLNIGVAQDAASLDSTAPLVRGCYLSVDEYLTNSPSFVDSFYLTFKPRLQANWEGTLSRTPRYGGEKKKIKDIWGFSDGYDAYVKHQSDYFKIQKDSVGYFFIGYEKYDFSRPSNAVIISGAAGGAIGVVISSQIIRDNCKKERIRYGIQETYGWAMHPNPKYNYSIPVEKVVFYRLSKKESLEPFTFMVNDSLTYSLGMDCYAEIRLIDGTTSVSISYGKGFSKSETFTLDEKEIDYFKFSIPAKTQELTLEKVSDSEGEFYSDSAMKAQEKRKRKEAKD